MELWYFVLTEKNYFKGWRPDEDAHSDIPHRSVVPLCKTIMPALRYSPIIVPHFELVKLLLTITRVLLSKSYPIEQVYRLFIETTIELV